MLALIGTLLGGLGLFLLAVSMITDGLKLAAGDALRDILARSTSTRGRGVASGILVTGVVQSSSAVTVATIGFVNAGLLNMVQALGIVYGANIGTTMTGWLVAAIGFNFKIEAFALPLIGLGMAARLLGPATRFGAIGEALAGFGLFFIGVDVLRDAFEGFAGSLDLAALSPDSALGILLYVGFGFIATLLTQSSSAAIAITLTAATGGVLAIDAAAAMVIGANVGTTSTAAFSVIGATSNAKRVAAAHVVFNLVTGAVALMLLPFMLMLVNWTGQSLGMDEAPAVTLALFHSTFNILGVLLMWPVTDALARFLSARFVTQAETLSRPAHLDRNVLITPVLALDALRLELVRMLEICRDYTVGIINMPGKTIAQQEKHDALMTLTDTVEQFVSNMERGRMTADTSTLIPDALRVNSYIEEIANLVHEISVHHADVEHLRAGAVAEDIRAFQQEVAGLVLACDPAAADFDSVGLEQRYESLHTGWHDLKAHLLLAASEGELPIRYLNAGLDRLRSCLRISEQAIKAAYRLRKLAPEPVESFEPTGEEHLVV